MAGVVLYLLSVCGMLPSVSPLQSTIPISTIYNQHTTQRQNIELNIATTPEQEVPAPGSSSTTTTTTTTMPTLEEALKTSYQEGMKEGKVGNWEELHGNWILRPRSQDTPRAVLHFLGGALVGASPHITYRYTLERLAEKGFLIVATPYQLSFDHLKTCDDVITRFELMAPSIARQYGALPVVGIGHSCGALLQLLITCLFPDTPRAANALISFNNKPVKEAVPFFEEIFTPFFTSLATPATTNGTISIPTSNELIQVGLELAKSATRGELPSDQTLQKLFLFPGGPISQDEVKIPEEIRDVFSKTFSPTVGALKEAGVLPILDQAIVSLNQIPKLVGEVGGVSDGARDFVPTPSAVQAAARKAYRARRTLVIEYADDPFDESDQIEELMKEAEARTRMIRPMVEIDTQRVKLDGGHATPLIAPPLDVAERAEDLFGQEAAKEQLQYDPASKTVDELLRWLEEGNL